MTTVGISSADRVSLLTREQLETLLHLSQAFNSTIDLDSLLPRILDQTLGVTESEAGSIWIIEGDHVRCAHAAGEARTRLVGVHVPLGYGVIGEAIRSGASVVTADALADEHFAAYRDGTNFRTRSAVTIPLVVVGEPLGAIQLVNDVGGKDVFSVEDVAFLESLADDAAAALRNARLFAAERRARNLRALLEVSNEITATFDVDRILFSIVNLAERAVRFERCIIAVHERDELRVRAISGEDDVDRKSAAVKEIERFLQWEAQRGGALFLNDLQSSEPDAVALRERFASYLKESGARGLLILPVADAEGELGRLVFEFGAPDVLTDWMREAAEMLANQAALALRNAQLYADVPFISWLEPLAQKRRAFSALPASDKLRYIALAVLAVALLVFVRLPIRVRASEAVVHAAVQRPARAGAEGVIEEIFVQEGDRVSAGQPVARIRNEALLVRLSDAHGALRLAERQGLTAQAIGNTSEAATARMRGEQLRIEIALLEREVSSLTVRAPAAGVVLTPRLDERVGSHRAAGEPVAWIGEADRAEIRLQVPQKDVAYIQPNDRVRVRVAARPEIRFDGQVSSVAPLAEIVGGEPHYTVRAILDNQSQILRPGMQARARVLTASRPLGYLLIRRPWRWARLHLWW